MVDPGPGDKFLVFLVSSGSAWYFTSWKFSVALTLSIVVVWIVQTLLDNNYWSRHGIPSPSFSLTGVTAYMRDWHLLGKQNFEKLGKTYGDSLLGRKNVMSKDFDLLRRVLVSDSAHFRERPGARDTQPSIDDKSLLRNVLTAKKGDDWKRIRSVVTPAFTSGKLRRIAPILEDSAKHLCDAIDRYIEQAKEIPLKDFMGRATLDMIARCGFAMDAKCFDFENESPFVTHNRNIGRPRLALGMALGFFPWVADKLQTLLGVDFTNSEDIDFFRHILEQLYDQRASDTKANEQYNDLFQLLLNSVDEGDDDTEASHDGSVRKPSNRINKMELLAQCFVLLIAGYDSTGNTMHFILYYLAKLPDLQRKVQQEIEDVVGESEDVSYDHIMNLPYLQQVINETLRMYPPAVLLSRQCSEPITINGIPFEKGTLLSVPVYRIHHDPEIYPEPEKFDPDRFSQEQRAQRDPLAFLPFGHGPMNCLGMRLAEIELRVTMAVLLRHYNFYPGRDSPELPLEIECVGLLQSKKQLFVTAERRV